MGKDNDRGFKVITAFIRAARSALIPRDDSEVVRQPEAVFSHVVAVGHARSAVKKQNDRIFIFRSPNVNRLSKPTERHALLAVYRISAHRKHLTCINNLIVAPFGAQTNKKIIKNGAARTDSPKI